MTDWAALSARAGISSHRLVGWIFWDPRGIANYEALGVPDGFGYYVATRSGPLAPAGAGAVAAAFYSISPAYLTASLDLCAQHTDWESAILARDGAVVPGLTEIDPDLPGRLAEMEKTLWAAADQIPSAGRTLFAAHRDRARPEDRALSSWLAVNCLREWRGDTHWALCLANGLGMVEVGILHNSYMGYETDWIPRSRGADDAMLDAAWQSLGVLGLADGREVNDAGRQLREEIEVRTDELCVAIWQAVGSDATIGLCDLIDEHEADFMARVEATAGSGWMPAVRARKT